MCHSLLFSESSNFSGRILLHFAQDVVIFSLHPAQIGCACILRALLRENQKLIGGSSFTTAGSSSKGSFEPTTISLFFLNAVITEPLHLQSCQTSIFNDCLNPMTVKSLKEETAVSASLTTAVLLVINSTKPCEMQLCRPRQKKNNNDVSSKGMMHFQFIINSSKTVQFLLKKWQNHKSSWTSGWTNKWYPPGYADILRQNCTLLRMTLRAREGYGHVQISQVVLYRSSKDGKERIHFATVTSNSSTMTSKCSQEALVPGGAHSTTSCGSQSQKPQLGVPKCTSHDDHMQISDSKWHSQVHMKNIEKGKGSRHLWREKQTQTARPSNEYSDECRKSDIFLSGDTQHVYTLPPITTQLASASNEKLNLLFTLIQTYSN